jgi:Flp pilus assembly protein TadD
LNKFPALIGALAMVASPPAHAYTPKASERALYAPMGQEQAAAYKRALELVERRDHGAAIAAFDETLRLQPQFAVAMTHRAFALMELGEYGPAIEGHDAVLQLAPNRPNSWANSCWARAVANTDLDQGLAMCDRAITMGDDVGAYDARGLVHFRRGEFQKAIDDYSRAIRANRRFASSRFMRGVARLRLGKDVEARRDIAWALKLDPGVQDTYARRGVQP